MRREGWMPASDRAGWQPRGAIGRTDLVEQAECDCRLHLPVTIRATLGCVPSFTITGLPPVRLIGRTHRVPAGFCRAVASDAPAADRQSVAGESSLLWMLDGMGLACVCAWGCTCAACWGWPLVRPTSTQ